MFKEKKTFPKLNVNKFINICEGLFDFLENIKSLNGHSRIMIITRIKARKKVLVYALKNNLIYWSLA